MLTDNRKLDDETSKQADKARGVAPDVCFSDTGILGMNLLSPEPCCHIALFCSDHCASKDFLKYNNRRRFHKNLGAPTEFRPGVPSGDTPTQLRQRKNRRVIMFTTRMSEAQKEFLTKAARRYIWWDTVDGAMT